MLRETVEAKKAQVGELMMVEFKTVSGVRSDQDLR